MRKLKMIINVSANFIIGDCENCSLFGYTDSFEEPACCEGICVGLDVDCPLKEIGDSEEDK